MTTYMLDVQDRTVSPGEYLLTLALIGRWFFQPISAAVTLLPPKLPFFLGPQNGSPVKGGAVILLVLAGEIFLLCCRGVLLRHIIPAMNSYPQGFELC